VVSHPEQGRLVPQHRDRRPDRLVQVKAVVVTSLKLLPSQVTLHYGKYGRAGAGENGLPSVRISARVDHQTPMM
jgi:phosphopantetheinyl transferase